MRYGSTRGGAEPVSAFEAVAKGLAPDGGLYVPMEIPKFLPGELKRLAGLPYTARATAILRRFFDDFSDQDLTDCVQGAWGARSRFDGAPAPLRSVGGAHVLELWHGPTCAFKDMALQFLPRAMVCARRALGIKEQTLILVATSGDTGKAALEGFADVPGTRCAVFYPEGGVSGVQRLQMETQRGGNVSVIAVKGNFDDAQTGVKRIFADGAMQQRLKERGWALSSANSINWGRLAPQIVYYVSAWCDLTQSGELAEGEKLDFVVPTGNFGNILAGWYAREMGLPIGRLVCASNRNCVLTDFFREGIYDIGRQFHKTISPSMDILVSSNLERMLFEASRRDAAVVRGCMEALKTNGQYRVSADVKAILDGIFVADCADDAQTRACLRDVYEEYGYLLDPHTAVAWDVWRRQGTGGKAVIVSTANPYKFAGDVLNALHGDTSSREGGREDCEALYALSGVEPPKAITEIWGLPERHNRSCAVDGMAEALLGTLNP